MALLYTTIQSPLGLIGLASGEKGLLRIRVSLANESEFPEYLETRYRQIPSKRSRAFSDLQDQFELYFKGRLSHFVCRPDFGPATPFQRLVWRQLTTIPYGETRSYRWLARAVGKPAAYRAAGNANGKNPLPIVVPCHRVIRENGQLGGYTRGTHIKQFLLDLEHNRHGAA